MPSSARVPLLEHRSEYCAIERPSGGDNRWGQPFRRELVEPSLIVIGVEIVRTRPCPAIVFYPDCCIAGVAWITGDVHPCHPHSLRHEFVEPLLVDVGTYIVVSCKSFH